MEKNFAQRMGLAKVPKPLKQGEFSERIRNRINNAFEAYYAWYKDRDPVLIYGRCLAALLEFNDCDLGIRDKRLNSMTELQYDYGSQRMDEYIENALTITSWINYCCFLERLVQQIDKLAPIFNKVFEEEMFAYRFIDGLLTPVTDDEEIKAIEDALTNPHGGIVHHLKQSLSLLGKKPVPDYRNSIKESISAVEVACREITGENTLGKALSKLNSKHKLNSQFKDGLEKFYAFTNNEGSGIRHALMDSDADIGYAEAKYMLVSCSAFVNYLKDKYTS